MQTYALLGRQYLLPSIDCLEPLPRLREHPDRNQRRFDGGRVFGKASKKTSQSPKISHSSTGQLAE